jgi:cyclohexadienyl dehydratase
VLLVLVAFLALWSSSPQAAPAFDDPAQYVEQILELSGERRALMREVAAWKWRQQRPITDPERERELIERMREQAQVLGLSPGAVEDFFELQMRWAREQQALAFAEWQDKQVAVPTPRDLSTQLRPELDRIGRELLLNLYLGLPQFQAEDFRDRYEARLRAKKAISPDELSALLDALSNLRRIDRPALARIRASRILRVGLTGDYAPFAVESQGQLHGADIRLATEFAAQERLQLRFVRTSWSTLMADYLQGRFDLAIGGISVTAERAALAAFSLPYHTGGKTPIVRCGEESLYDTLTEINRPVVRVVVNPGGTNERFARERLGQARLLVHPDNRTVFDEIAARRADVMVTDDVEVDLQTRARKDLCRATSTLFTRADKAWMLSKDPALLAAVNGWMQRALDRGDVRRALGSATLH